MSGGEIWGVLISGGRPDVGGLKSIRKVSCLWRCPHFSVSLERWLCTHAIQ